MFWNERSLNKRKNDLPGLLSNLDIFLCVESWLQDSSNSGGKQVYTTFVPGFVQLQKNRHNFTGGGILIMVRKHIAFCEIEIESPDKNLEMYN